MEFKISEKLLQKIIDYLAIKPYSEVFMLLNEISNEIKSQKENTENAK